jgi:mRNA-degrading endonuclease RelE of RelBE toxin-antitoxin system
MNHIRALTARQRSIIIDAMSQQLVYEPTVKTKNRKQIRPNFLASWELRIGELRVYYDVEEGFEAIVEIVAIGIKERNRVRIGDRIYEELS